jgi:histidinol phosphatase-like PHP family hydrolase
MGYGALAITDHADASNLDELVTQLLRFFRDGVAGFGVTFVPGVELTHIPPSQIAPLAQRARRLGARLIVVHGETPVEPVAPGTNRAAVECPDVDLLAHPGFITQAEAAIAASNGVALELSARGGHCLTNGHVALMARASGARLVVNTDTHTPSDMIDQARARLVALGAGLTEEEAHTALITTAWEVVAKALSSPPGHHSI